MLILNKLIKYNNTLKLIDITQLELKKRFSTIPLVNIYKKSGQ
mgnify:CR=1 FL=1